VDGLARREGRGTVNEAKRQAPPPLPNSAISGLRPRFPPEVVLREVGGDAPSISPSPTLDGLTAELVEARAQIDLLRSERDALARALAETRTERDALARALTEATTELAALRGGSVAVTAPDPAPPERSPARETSANEPPATAPESEPPLDALSDPPTPASPREARDALPYSPLKNLVVSPSDGEKEAAGERRAEARLACEFQVEFVHDTHFYAGLTQDISCGGIFVATYHLLPIGTRLVVNFELPDGSAVRAGGEVRWIREEEAAGSERPGLGVAFTDLDDEALGKIADFCRSRPPLYFDV
jgi:uncharacterized protein (TIGR02266 family)